MLSIRLFIFKMAKQSYISKTHLTNKEVNIIKKPNWIKVKAPQSNIFSETKDIIKKFDLNTVCEEAACPNIGECWNKKHATFMILGRVCTRKCTFCNIATGHPNKVDPNEPKKIAEVVNALNLKHVVITSVDRDDLDDGGASQFKECIQHIRKLKKNITVEILTPDFQRKSNAIEIILKAKPDVFNHNLETIPRLYKEIRKGADYLHSLNLLKKVKDNSNIFTKSGIMVGLGETFDEIYKVMNDMREHKVDFLTVGQYLQPSTGHQKLIKYYSLDEFRLLEENAKKLGFKMVSCSPLTRSSYHADEYFEKLRKIYA